jgi:lantibiotic leader peptide-processing serine protease
VSRDSASLPQTLDADISAFGGSVVRSIPQIGVAIVASDRADFQALAGQLQGVDAVVPDLETIAPASSDPNWLSATAGDGIGGTASALTAAPPMPPGGDPLSPLQWALTAIHAPDAWALGYKGHGARVAVLDAGIQSTHPDLVANLNTTLSTSFVPGQAYNTPPGPHGTQVAGIIAAAQNGIGTVGVAPQAEIVAVKVLSATTGSGRDSWILSGITYAADIGADVINMSFGGNSPRRPYIAIDTRGTTDPSDDIEIPVSAAETEQTLRAYRRAVNYAHGKGVLLIAASGNLGKDFGHSQSDFGVPQELPHVVTIGPTGPLGWALDPQTDLDVSPSYTNFGKSYISLAAPGGNFDVFTRPGLPPSCTVLGFTRPCQVFDIVYTTTVGSSYFWNFGGSFAAPHASGVAALIIGKHGGGMDPDRVEQILRNTADDIGKPGNDERFGQGRVNALRAVQQP